MNQPFDQRLMHRRTQGIAASPDRRDERSAQRRWANAGMIVALGLANGWALWLVARMLDPGVVPQFLP